MLDSLYLHSYAKQTAHMLASGTIELAFVQIVLKLLVTCLRKLISRHLQRPVYSLTLF